MAWKTEQFDTSGKPRVRHDHDWLLVWPSCCVRVAPVGLAVHSPSLMAPRSFTALGSSLATLE